ncbi:MAG: SMP-30/gluconolactonase/LRE family protein [Actinobacteria bacterium]|nr:SMP-30/gluconolactonase/LRE family protein [Actinomycetota bacterium]
MYPQEFRHSLSIARRDPDHLGEGTTWDPRSGHLITVDITAGLVHLWRPGSSERETFSTDGEVSAAVPCRDGGFVLAVEHRLLLRSEDGAQTVLAEVETHIEENRFNDCRCDPQGRLWAGTMSRQRRAGEAALYRLDPDGELTKVIDGTTISNGLAWNASGQLMYFIDSTTQRIDVFDFDPLSGEIEERRPFIEVAEADGLPDGMTVDAEGCIWVALFGGGAIHRYTPDAELDTVISLPVTNPTCPGFGGADLDVLYLTSARHRLSPEQLAVESLAGSLLAIEGVTPGRPTNLFVR